ncbi:hypothetical protein scyTo_0018287 [Scyliorhinus torazame]|uniref:Uncharacterized protein n=1 Tax=Scyliorhinus torazame TaxID=75743 RepID=A0A401PS99_SCYTO|nr:hypothetical protein [Scyliorhinus torazame]
MPITLDMRAGVVTRGLKKFGGEMDERFQKHGQELKAPFKTAVEEALGPVREQRHKMTKVVDAQAEKLKGVKEALSQHKDRLASLEAKMRSSGTGIRA